MKITKITHCTLLFEFIDGSKVLTDPGKMKQEDYHNLTGLNYLILTDIHQDHYSKEGIGSLLKNNPHMELIVTDSVKSKLEADFNIITHNIIVINSKVRMIIGKMKWRIGLHKHIPAYKHVIPAEEIIWYQIEDKYFGSGDTYKLPKGQVELLGQNVIATFGSMEKFIDYALKAKPKRVFNIHDGYLNKDFTVGYYAFVKKYLGEYGIEYLFIEDGESITLE